MHQDSGAMPAAGHAQRYIFVLSRLFNRRVVEALRTHGTKLEISQALG